MRLKAPLFIPLACVAFALGLASCRHMPEDDSGAASLKVGAAEIDITPPIGQRMAGYFDERLATGIHDPLLAKAMVLQEGHERIALAFCDLVGLSLNVSTNARARASHRTGIAVSNIMICATHSHTGPLFDDVRRDVFHQRAVAEQGKDLQETVYYPDFLIERLVKVISEAQANLRPAELSAGVARQEGLAFNRRYWMRNGRVAFNPGLMNTNILRPAGPTDPEVGIILAGDSKTRKYTAGVTVFAMHSDTVGGSLYSADYAYYIQETLRAALGKDFISAFGAGTCGDINHINVHDTAPIKGFAVAEHLGRTLGRTVIEAAPQLKALDHLSLATRSSTLRVPLQEVTPEQLADARSKQGLLGDTNADFTMKVIAVKRLDLARRGSWWPMEVQVFRLDSETALVCLPCEIFVELGLAIKLASPFKNTMVISICNDRPGYVPTRKAFSEGSYEITNSRVKPGGGEMMVDEAIKLLEELKADR